MLIFSNRKKDFWHDDPPINTSSTGSFSAGDYADKSHAEPQPVTRAIDESKAGEKSA